MHDSHAAHTAPRFKRVSTASRKRVDVVLTVGQAYGSVFANPRCAKAVVCMKIAQNFNFLQFKWLSRVNPEEKLLASYTAPP
ncbi:hypothetical protein [Comamonas sp.]|uniref:hypothetical protein n=1 Tax=Comamonas sp. TaxID=34028 RepID=UPI003A8E4907